MPPKLMNETSPEAPGGFGLIFPRLSHSLVADDKICRSIHAVGTLRTERPWVQIFGAIM